MKWYVSFFVGTLALSALSGTSACAVMVDFEPTNQVPLKIVTSEQVEELATLIKITLGTTCELKVCNSSAKFDITSQDREGTLFVKLMHSSEDRRNSTLSFLVEYPEQGFIAFEDRGLDGKVDVFFVYDLIKNLDGSLTKTFRFCFNELNPDICSGAELEPEVLFRDGLYGVSVTTLTEALQVALKKTGLKI